MLPLMDGSLDCEGHKSKVKVIFANIEFTFGSWNTIESKPMSIFWTNVAQMLTMMSGMINSADFVGHWSKVKVINKCGVRRSGKICFVWFILYFQSSR